MRPPTSNPTTPSDLAAPSATNKRGQLGLREHEFRLKPEPAALFKRALKIAHA